MRGPTQEAASSLTPSSLRTAILEFGPVIDRGSAPEPTCVAVNADETPVRSRTRSSHPVRRLEPGAARSSSSWAEKCERVASGVPTSWTSAIWPASHSGLRAFSPGCMPKTELTWVTADTGRPMPGRSEA